jgi:putative tryptophan/tyrosine transport system substrate-binding protein
MRRREFIAVLGGAVVAWPMAVRAQQPDRPRRIGVLMNRTESDPEYGARLTAFRQGLEKFGWTGDRNARIDYRRYLSDAETGAATADLLGLAPDVILASGTPGVRALHQATRTVPIVFVAVGEPLEQGFIQSLAHPSGNITGFANMEPTVGAKFLELLKEIAPSVRRVAIMFNRGNPSSEAFSGPAQMVAQKFAMEATEAPVDGPAGIEAIMTMLGAMPGGGLIVPPDAFIAAHRKLVFELAARYRLPAVYGSRYFAAEGGLVSYGVDIPDQFRQAAAYVDRILRGEKPADLPVQQPTKFELIINLKTAKALGLEVPLQLLYRADEVIE